MRCFRLLALAATAAAVADAAASTPAASRYRARHAHADALRAWTVIAHTQHLTPERHAWHHRRRHRHRDRHRHRHRPRAHRARAADCLRLSTSRLASPRLALPASRSVGRTASSLTRPSSDSLEEALSPVTTSRKATPTSGTKLVAKLPSWRGGGGALPIAGVLSLAGGVLAHLVLGTLYCWGNFISYAPEGLLYFDGLGADAHGGATVREGVRACGCEGVKA